MPIAKSGQRINLDQFLIDQANAHFGSQEEFGGLEFGACHSNFIDRDCLVIFEPDPHHVHRHDQSLVANFSSAHKSKAEIRKKIAGAGTKAETVAARSSSTSVHSRKPEIGADRKMPSIICGSRAGM